MKVIELEQGSPEWRAWRLNHIGGSDANLICAYFLPDYDYPYGTWAGADLYRLWAIKCGRIIEKEGSDNSWGDYVDPRKHGNDMEPIARQWYMEETGELALPMCIEHETLPYLSASLDGFTGTRPVEIKCPKEPEDHIKAKEGIIPDKYFAQFQHNLFVSGCEVLDYVSYYKGEGIRTEVLPAEDFLTSMREAEDIFWFWVTTKQFPVPPSATQDDSQLWETYVTEYFKAQVMQREAERWQRKVKAQMARWMMEHGAGKITGGGATVALRVRGASEVKAFKKDEGLMLDVRRA